MVKVCFNDFHTTKLLWKDKERLKGGHRNMEAFVTLSNEARWSCLWFIVYNLENNIEDGQGGGLRGGKKTGEIMA